ncbi:MAG: hypothetical protein HYT87_12520 [Nitrospirae bacterium]|nr:hypothetical protein [Nitrospirota bacterium]
MERHVPHGSSGILSRTARVAAAFGLMAAVDLGRSAAAGSDETRIRAGLRLFRALVAADVGLEHKVADDGRLLIVFFYQREKSRARELADGLNVGGPSGGEAIRGLPVLAEIHSDSAFNAYEGRAPVGIFIAEALDPARLRSVIQYGIRNGLIVYSPFEGDVESGVLGGVSVEAQVRPYINTRTLEASRISLKPFFMKVTKAYP